MTDETVPREDEANEKGQEIEGKEAETDCEVVDETEAINLEYAKLSMERLATAIAYVEAEVPCYGGRASGEYEFDQSELPASVEKARQRSLISAYGLISREFDATMGKENF